MHVGKKDEEVEEDHMPREKGINEINENKNRNEFWIWIVLMKNGVNIAGTCRISE